MNTIKYLINLELLIEQKSSLLNLHSIKLLKR
uniref:Uncharacterized protein n=1 Tax=virus sp. ctEQ64 TaxID=2825809 RepID=A0A8S5RKI4_9VIRU|nr:MAG TPA: hypothetical protein [virus sp. ctEQ64]